MVIFTIILSIIFAICLATLNDKVNGLKKQLDERTKELRLLTTLVMKEQKVVNMTDIHQKDVKAAIVDESIKLESAQHKINPEQQARFEEFKRKKEQQNNSTNIQVQKGLENKKEGFENVFGKHVLGFIAAILVFIGMLAFGSLIFNYVDDIFKTVMVFAFSVAITTIGVFIHKKNANAFSESVMGCGAGATFISIFISHLFFNTFSDIVAFVLVLIWAIGVFVLSRKVNSTSLLYIAHIGCLISILMAMGSSFEERVFEIAIYQILTIMILLAMDMKIHDNLFKITVISAMIMNNVLACCCYDELYFGETSIFAVIALVSITTFMLHVIGHKRIIVNKYAETIASSVLYIFGVSVLLSSIAEIMTTANYFVLNVAAVFIVAGTLSGLVLTTDDQECHKVNTIIMVPFLSIIALYSSIVSGFEPLSSRPDVIIPGVLFYALILLGLYYKNKKKAYLISGLILLFLDGFSVLFMLEELSLVLYISILVFITFLISWIHEQNIFSLGIVSVHMINTCWIISFLMFMYNVANEQTEGFLLAISLIIISLINILFRWFYRNNAEENSLYKSTCIIMDVELHIAAFANSCFVSVVLSDEYTTLCYITLLALSIISFVIGMIGLMDVMEKEDHALGIWYAIKFTMLTIIPLFQFTDMFDEQFVFSIVLMVIAAICILFGFKFKNKSIRIYGLVVILMSVIKIVIIDMWGQDSMIRVVALMAGGMICFAISALYNKFEKKLTLQASGETRCNAEFESSTLLLSDEKGE